MADAVVASTERPRVAGDIKFHIVRFTALANTNTHVITGAPRILGAVPISVSTSAAVTFTASGGTLTANVSAGAPDVTALVLIG